MSSKSSLQVKLKLVLYSLLNLFVAPQGIFFPYFQILKIKLLVSVKTLHRFFRKYSDHVTPGFLTGTTFCPVLTIWHFLEGITMGKKFVMMSLSRLQNLYYFQDKVDILHPTRANQEYQLSQVHCNKKVAFQLGLRCIQLKFLDLLQWTYLFVMKNVNHLSKILTLLRA